MTNVIQRHEHVTNDVPHNMAHQVKMRTIVRYRKPPIENSGTPRGIRPVSRRAAVSVERPHPRFHRAQLGLQRHLAAPDEKHVAENHREDYRVGGEQITQVVH